MSFGLPMADNRAESRIPQANSPWPPLDNEAISYQYRIWSAWLSGDIDQLAWVYYNLSQNSPVARAYFATTGERGLPVPKPGQYRGGLLGSINRTFHGQPVPPGEKRTRYHIPLAGDIAATSADLLFSRFPKVTAKEKGTQTALDQLLDDGAHATFLEAAEMCSALGGVFLRTVWDTEVSDRPWIDLVAADAAVPRFSYRKLVGVTFWRILSDDGKEVVRHLETHVPGQNRIVHGVYKGDQQDLGRQYALTDFPETQQFAQYLTAGDSIEFPDQPKDASTVTYIPNMLPNRIWRQLGPQAAPLGRSDYSGCETLLDALDETWCVDEETEILTGQGWVKYPELHSGDDVLTLNHDTGLSEWQPVLEVCVFPAQEREMVSIETRSHSSLTTPDHRWPVLRPHFRHSGNAQGDYPADRAATGRAARSYKAVAGFDRTWATSDTFKFDDRVPLLADCADLPGEPKYTDALVEAVAWFWTEGHIRKLRDGRLGQNLVITQSPKNAANCQRIASSLTRAFGPAVDQFPCNGRGAGDGVPRWREMNKADGNRVFSLNIHAGEIILEHAPGRVPSYAFLRCLTKAQLGLFIQVSMLADNCGPHALAQKDRAAAEAFQFACILAGHGTSVRQNTQEHYARHGYSMTMVRIKSQPYMWPGRPGVRERVTYDGHVWCPRTQNQTWLARRNGKVYFTGNTSWMRDIQLAKARLIVPQGYVDNIGRGKGGVFDPDRQVYVPVASLAGSGGASQDIMANQFKIRYLEHKQTISEAISQVVRRAGYSVGDFGEDDSTVALTATEIEARERRSLITRDKKILYWRPATRDILYGLLSVQATMFGDRSITVERPDINWTEIVLPDKLEIAQTAAALAGAEAASKQTLVQMVHPDWTTDQIDEEVQRINLEVGTELLTHARIDLAGVVGEPLGQQIQDIVQPVSVPDVPAHIPGEDVDMGGQ